MSTTSLSEGQGGSTRPYLIRALHEWCTDNGFTPYLAVHVDGHVQVPKEYVKNDEIVLNVGFDATQGLKLGNELIEFRARFGGVARDISVPVDHVVAIYARENGQGMAFPSPAPMPATPVSLAPQPERAPPNLRLASQEPSAGSGHGLAPAPSPATDGGGDEPAGPGGGRPALKRIK